MSNSMTMESDSDYVEEIYEQPYEIARKQLSMRLPPPIEKPKGMKKNRVQAIFVAISIIWIAMMTAWVAYASVQYIKNAEETKLTMEAINGSLSAQAESLLQLMAGYSDLKLILTNASSTNGFNATEDNNMKTPMAAPKTATPAVASKTVSTTTSPDTPIPAAIPPEPTLPARGFHPLNPATSCGSISNSNPSSYYWLLASNGSSVRVFCHMIDTCGAASGGWMRVAHLDTKQSSAQCPAGLCRRSQNPRACGRCSSSGSCVSQTYQVGVTYSRVCGRIIAYQLGTLEAYSRRYTNEFDGIRLAYGNPEVNIWTFYGAVSENYFNSDSVCPCINPSDNNIPPVPSSVGNHYFCDTAASFTSSSTFYSEDPLWDGAGCSGSNSCCSFNNPPWFKRDLPSSTTENIEMRMCLNLDPSQEDIAIEMVDIYVQ